MFKSLTKEEAINSLEACQALLSKIYDKGNCAFDDDDANVLEQSIETVSRLLKDVDLNSGGIVVCEYLTKAQLKLYEQKIKNVTGFYGSTDQKAPLLKALSHIKEALMFFNNM